MPIFKSSKQRLSQVKELKIDLEKNLQRLVEQNLHQVFGLRFICSEFQLNNLRVDTIGFDEETKSFVILEYKKDRSSSVIDQGYAYLSLMVNNKADFILLYNERNEKGLKKEDVDWSQTRVFFLANTFTTHQRSAINFKDLPISLWEVKKFEHDLILFNELKSQDTSESIKTVTKDRLIENVSREIKKYTVDDLFKEDWKESNDIFNLLSERILDIDSRLEINPQKSYISFRIGSRNMVATHIYKSKVMLVLSRTEPKDLKDPDKKVTYWKGSLKYYNQHLSIFNIKSREDVDYAIFLIKQIHKKYFERD